MAFLRGVGSHAAGSDPRGGVGTGRRRHRCRLHRQRRNRVPVGDRSRRPCHAREPRAAGLGCHLRDLRGAVSRGRASAPRRDRPRSAHQHPAGECGARDGGQPEPVHRGNGERHVAATDRQRRVRHLRAGFHRQRRGRVHGRRVDGSALPRSVDADGNHGSRCCACRIAWGRLLRRGGALSPSRRARRAVRRVVRGSYRRRDQPPRYRRLRCCGSATGRSPRPRPTPG